MLKNICFLSAVFLITNISIAQTNGDKKILKGYSHSIGLDLSLPIGQNFSETNSVGVGINYSWSNRRFGKHSTIPKKPIGFILNSGVDYFFGKKETTGTYTYDNPGLSVIHAYGGIMHNPCSNGYIDLTAGPVLEIWDGGTEFGFGINLGGSVGIRNNIGIHPFIGLMKYSDSDPIYSAGIRCSYSF